MDLELRKAIHHLLWIWAQYGPSENINYADKLRLDHQFMSAGEQAGDFLASHGVGIDEGREIKLTPLGMEIYNDESLLS